ncbi:MAG: MBL fold metallo-hydrolase [Desulfurococcales archaeon]|nr:MBL fold metallo-hydrolase [Desulfurococcales archaeon]
MASLRVRVLVDNSAPLPTRLLPEYGFSALVEDLRSGVRVLFDTGSSGLALERNLAALGVDPSTIDFVVLSHRHYDHTGGLRRLLELRGGRPVTVVAHERLFEPAYARLRLLGGVLRDIGLPHGRRELEELGARFLLVRGPVELTDTLTVSGEIPREWGPSHAWGMLRLEGGRLVEDEMLDDMALYARVEGGLVAVTGCGHAGVENIVEYGLELSGEEGLHALVGGLHLLGAPPGRVGEVVAYLKSKKPGAVAAMHCTGPLAQAPLAEALGGAYRLGGVGFTLEA